MNDQQTDLRGLWLMAGCAALLGVAAGWRLFEVVTGA